ncbi:MAG: type III-B CRISPR module RAMP protein Cmr4 [Firmicutes bacterium]|nr:type III-B CRISPR module RAMP protein Cmr4 [Bacillota bacterium]
MKSAVLGMFAESAMHLGTESTGGLIDLPVAREAATGYPLVPSSSLKGSLRDKARNAFNKTEVEALFGEQDKAGGIAVTDARLLLLPVRSLTSHYVWVTCPYMLERLQRDMKLVGKQVNLKIESPKDGQVFAASTGKLLLEELTLETDERTELIQNSARVIAPLIGHESVRNRLEGQLVIVSNNRMAYFATYCLTVRARNQLNETTKISENLWYEETLPPDSLFYFSLIQRPDRQGSVEQAVKLFDGDPYLQVGGNETMGQGWCAISLYEEGE